MLSVSDGGSGDAGDSSVVVGSSGGSRYVQLRYFFFFDLCVYCVHVTDIAVC